MELSEEMQEAIRILKSDGRIAAFNQLSASHKEVVERLDHMEDEWSSYRASQDAKDPAKPEEQGTPSDPQTPSTPDPNIPEPPPEIPEDEKKDDGVKHRLHWWERGYHAS